MGKKTERALVAIQDALAEQAAEINEHGSRLDKLEKVVQSQATDIAALEQHVQNLRNRSIQLAIDRGVPTRVVAQAHGLTPGRISQLAPRKRPQPAEIERRE